MCPWFSSAPHAGIILRLGHNEFEFIIHHSIQSYVVHTLTASLKAQTNKQIRTRARSDDAEQYSAQNTQKIVFYSEYTTQ
jgi:hypothetical protein